jgi:hypothetical protein
MPVKDALAPHILQRIRLDQDQPPLPLGLLSPAGETLSNGPLDERLMFSV